MSRKSNLVYTYSKDEPPHFICRKDIHFSQEAVTLYFTWSKTNQFGARIHKVPLIAIPNSVLCPVQALFNMLSLVPAQPHDALFSVPGASKKLIPVSYANFQKFLKNIVSLVGIDSTNFSTHSFRRGGATHAFDSNVPSELIKSHGDWSSDAYLVYLEFSYKQKLSVSSAMASNISNLKN
jgi:integrase